MNRNTTDRAMSPTSPISPLHPATTTLSLKGKIALITGAGADVVIADLKQAEAQATAAAIAQKGVRTLAIAMDVADEAAVDAGFDQVQKTWGYVDILVSNAGVQIVSPIETFQFSDWKKLMAVHLDGGFLTSRAAVRHMIASARGGSIIFMGSVHSKEASRLKSPYVAAKHGLEGLAKVIAKEGAEHNIRSNVICPGFVRTPLVDRQIPEQAQALLRETVDGQFTTLDDVAQVALTFATFPSNALTGQSLVVSHGWCMR